MQPDHTPIHLLRAFIVALLPLCAAPLQAQHDDRIWGRVFTDDGEVHEGFIHLRGYRGGASWTDLLVASKALPDQFYRDWREATASGSPHVRTVELKGYRITWVEKHPDWPGTARSGIRYGHLAELAIDEAGGVGVVTRASQRTGFEPGDGVRRFRDLGEVDLEPVWSQAELRIENADGSATVLGRDLQRVEFAPAPAGTTPSSPRLYGTAEDRSGRSFSGFVTWDRDQVLQSHYLDGLFDDGPGQTFPDFGRKYQLPPFSDIVSVEPTRCGVNLTSRSGTVEEMCTEPLAPDPPPVRISDPALGVVDVGWDALRILRLEPSPGTPGYGAFDGGHPLLGTVVTAEGEEIEGRIRWDADEEWSWEILHGRSHDVAFSIEFANVARIVRDERRGAHVTLLDGRTFQLTGGNDVDGDNKGIFVFPVAAEGADPGERADEWRYVAWEDFREARFRYGDASSGS